LRYQLSIISLYTRRGGGQSQFCSGKALTMLEQMLEDRAGISAYHGSFLLHYLDALVYPNVSLALLVTVEVAFCAGNLAYYVFRSRIGPYLRRHA
jgi:hypothetical protein